MAEAEEAWLRRHLPAGAALPDLAPESQDFVRRLAAASARRDRTERQLAQDAQHLAGRHAAELDEIEDVLQQCGLTPCSLPTAVSSSLGARLATRRAAFCGAAAASAPVAPDALGRGQTRCHQPPSRWARATLLCAACTAPSRPSRSDRVARAGRSTRQSARAGAVLLSVQASEQALGQPTVRPDTRAGDRALELRRYATPRRRQRFGASRSCARHCRPVWASVKAWNVSWWQ